MANETFLQIPNDVDDPVVLRRVLTSLVESIDEIRGNRGNDPSVTESQLVSTASNIKDLVEDFNSLDGQYLRIDGKNHATGILSYSSSETFSGNQIVDAAYVDKKVGKQIDGKEYIKKNAGTAPSPLAGDIDPAHISAKVDELIVAITAAGLFS